MPGKVVLAGGNGYIGKRLSKHLSDSGYEIVVLSREEVGCVHWDGRNLGPWTNELEGAVAVLNLAGVSVAKPWTEANRLAIFESRIESTRVLGKAIAGLQNPPKVWVNSSATGYYGDRGDEVLSETSIAGAKGNFLANLCVAWEDELERSATPNTRKVRVRIGVVFGQGSLAFEPIKRATTFFLGGHFGNGRQYMSWIHIHDLLRIFQWAMESDVTGAVNATASEPVQSYELMATMRAVMRRPWAPPVPSFVLKLISLCGGPDSSMLLESQRAVPEAAASAGFVFDYPRLREALVDLLLTQATTASCAPG